LERGAEGDVALLAPGRPQLTYSRLRAQVGRVAESLGAFGFRPDDRIAVVLSNGPELATAFLGVSCATTCAPLNTAYRAEEYEFYLSDLGARGVIVSAGDESEAPWAARRLGIPVIELSAYDDGPAGTFELDAPHVAQGTSGLPARDPDDVALVLHTSGTTARPKLVPLRQRNLAASANHVANTLGLSPHDRSLNVMPLFHIHGLVGVVLASLMAGSTVVCSPGFNPFTFYKWAKEFRPTWYSAVPSMHQAILARSSHNMDVVADLPLRFVRSSSAALAPRVIAELEDVFGVPAIDSYGMTEAAHQITSNPLPPDNRKPGTVGAAAGPDVAIMDERGTILAPGKTGEVVIRGPNVTSGYENAPEENVRAIVLGWLRTGDQGAIDHDGYLRLSGRLKEIINRGGEKVSPVEVDAVLLDHPAVAQAAAFPKPHRSLGEEVAAAVVLRDGQTIDPQELRKFVAEHLASFKVPRKIVFVDEIPKGPTGKLQRSVLAEKLGLTGE
jgi:acyl-CoA synthetase (AMP-forming)/AMP-acid ligase II